jgi:SEC-C motif-containing protein
MRSRYSAFVLRDAAYLRRTWSVASRPGTVPFVDDLRWPGLDILGHTGGSAFHTEGTVEFCAHFTLAGKPGEHRENSAFLRIEGDWFYDRAVVEPSRAVSP